MKRNYLHWFLIVFGSLTIIYNPGLARANNNSLSERISNKNERATLKHNSAQVNVEKNPVIKGYEITGNTIFSTRLLEGSLAPEIGKEINPTLLLKLGESLTLIYNNAGYTSSFAIVSGQNIKNGIVPIQIVEGRIKRVEIVDLQGSYLRKSYVQSLLKSEFVAKIYNAELVQAQLLELQQLDENIELFSVEAIENSEPPGSVTLNITAKASPAFESSLIAANTGSKAFGEASLAATARTRVIGNGDRLSALFGLTEGTDIRSFGYFYPTDRNNSGIFANYGRNVGDIVQNPLNFADINLQSEIYTLGYTKILKRRLRESLSISVVGSLEQTIGELEGERAVLIRGAGEDGKLRTSELGVGVDYFRRDAKNIFASQSRIKVGLPIFDATNNDGRPDGRYVVVENSAFYRRLFNKNGTAYFNLRINSQLGNGLPGSKTFAIGGRNTLRGIANNSFSTDNALVINGEIAIPLYPREAEDPNQVGEVIVQLIPFIDYAKGWNSFGPNPEINDLIAAGIGLQIKATDRVFFRIDYGSVLNQQIRVNREGLSGNGLYIGILITPLKR